jgi:hemoglobin
MEKKDLGTEQDIQLLVDTFYGKAMSDPLIGFIFTDVAKISLEHHMPVMYSFWGSMLLGTDNYRSNPMVKHMDLNKKTPLLPEHFKRWLEMWEETVNELFAGPMAVQTITRARNIASVMEYKVRRDRKDLPIIPVNS